MPARALRSAGPGTPVAWCVLVGGLALTFLGWRWVGHRVEDQAEHVFDRQVQLISGAVRARVGDYETVVRSGAALLAVAPRASRADWSRFVARMEIESQHPGVLALEVAARVAAPDLDQHVRAVRAEGFPEYEVHPAGVRPEYLPVVYLEPFAPNRRAFGYDLASEPTRREAAERARDTGTPAISGPIHLVQGTNAEARPAVLMLHPLYREDLREDLPATPTVAQRRAALAGFIVAVVSAHDLMRGILPNRMPGVDFEIFDGTALQAATPLYDDDDVREGLDGLPVPRFQRTLAVEVGGRVWTLRFNSLAAFDATLDHLGPYGALLGGLLASTLLFWIVRQQAVGRDRALALAREMTAELQAVFHAFPDVLVLLDADATVVDFRGGRENGTTVPPARFPGRRMQDLVPAHLVPEFEETFRRLRETHQPVLVEHALYRDGEERHYEVRMLALESAHVLVLARDITERVLADGKLRQSQRRLAEAERLGGTGNWYWEIGTDRLSWSDGNCQLYGIAPDEFVPAYDTWLTRVHPDDLAPSLDTIARIYRERRTLSWDFRIRHPGGDIRHLTCTGEAVSSKDGTVTALFGTTVDITTRTRADAALRESEQRFRQLADSIDQVFWIAELAPRRLLYISPAWETILGRSRESVRRDPPAWLASVHPDDRARIAQAHETWLASGAEHGVEEFRIVRPDGETRWIRNTRTVVLRVDGHVRRVGGVATDITAERLAQETREQLEARLRQAQKMEAIGTLAGGIAHDFNNILGIVVGFTELARLDADGNVAVRESLANVLTAAERAKDLVARMLAFARPQEPRRSPLAPAAVIGDALKLVRAALPTSIDIRTRLEPDLPPVLADATQLHQVIMNLASNAAHAMGERGGHLDIGLHQVDVGPELAATHPDLNVGPYVRLSVHDTGPGMDAATLERIFEPFFTTRGPSQGTGLGLSVVHGIVRGHGGAIVVQTRPGEGTAFEIYFPAEATAVPVAPDAPERLPGGHGERLLLVDDEPGLVDAGRRILESLGYRVTAVTDPTAALAGVQADPQAFDAVIADLTMPGMSGIDLARALRQLRPGVPFILTTGFGGRMTPASARALGITELLIKPVTRESLARAVHAALAAAAAARPRLRVVRGPSET